VLDFLKNELRAHGPLYHWAMAHCLLRFSKRLRHDDGFMLIEALISVFISTLVLSMSIGVFLSFLSTEVRMKNEGKLAVEANFVASWAQAHLVGADTPLVAADWKSIKFTRGGTCYLLSLDTSTGKLQSQSASSCNSVGSASPYYIAGSLTNTSSQPLFEYEDSQGDSIDISTQLSSARIVVINYRANNGILLTRTITEDIGP
jgi:hypothetical protein